MSWDPIGLELDVRHLHGFRRLSTRSIAGPREFRRVLTGAVAAAFLWWTTPNELWSLRRAKAQPSVACCGGFRQCVLAYFTHFSFDELLHKDPPVSTRIARGK